MKKRKELKDAYKQSRPAMGVFQIKNISNGKIFIDSSLDMMAKWNRHKAELKFGSHRNKGLQKDWKLQGEDEFKFEVLSELEPKKEEGVNYQRELKTLKAMILDELEIDSELFY